MGLSARKIENALKMTRDGSEEPDETECLAQHLGLPIYQIAQSLISHPSPEGTRQVFRNVGPVEDVNDSPIRPVH